MTAAKKNSPANVGMIMTGMRKPFGRLRGCTLLRTDEPVKSAVCSGSGSGKALTGSRFRRKDVLQCVWMQTVPLPVQPFHFLPS